MQRQMIAVLALSCVLVAAGYAQTVRLKRRRRYLACTEPRNRPPMAAATGNNAATDS